MSKINNYELYYEVVSESVSVEDFNHSKEYNRQGKRVAENNLPLRYAENWGWYNDYRLPVQKYKTDSQPTQKVQQSSDIDDYIYIELPKIIVWLGTSNTIYQNSARIVSYTDLEILAKNIFVEKPVRNGLFFGRYCRGISFRGSRYCYKRHSYVKIINKAYGDVSDNLEEYPQLARKKFKEKITFEQRNNWDFYDFSISKKSNGWKDNTKARKQYLRHEK